MTRRRPCPAPGHVRSPGAVLAALAWQAIQQLGTYYVAHALNGASATYGPLWPRNLLTPFVDNVDLTQSIEVAFESTPSPPKDQATPRN